MVSKLFMGYALAPDRPGSVFLVPGGALNTNFPSGRGVPYFFLLQAALGGEKVASESNFAGALPHLP